MTRRLSRVLPALALWALCAAPEAALPLAVDGKPLPSLADMLDGVTPAVVNIATETQVELRMNPLFNHPFFRRFFDLPNQPLRRRNQSLGSGVIVDAARGLVMTNNHVIANADDITVNLADGRELRAELIGGDPDTDVAVVRIEADNLTALPLADSSALRVGDFVVAIGNPFNLGQTVTSGIVSALGRSGLGITGYEDLIQTDASINPGNSGGALVNLRGELVGINTAIYSRSGGNIGIGFAIPVNMAQQIMNQLVEHGEVQRGFLGARFQDIDTRLAEAFGLSESAGAILVGVAEDSPAARAGLVPGDIITRFNDRRITNAATLRTQIGLAEVGTEVTIDFLRAGEPRRVTLTVAPREQLAEDGRFRNERLASMTVGDIPADLPAHGRVRGVLVFDIARNSPAFQAGIRKGDIISSVNRKATPSLQAFLAVVNDEPGQLLLRVHRGSQAVYMLIR